MSNNPHALSSYNANHTRLGVVARIKRENTMLRNRIAELEHRLKTQTETITAIFSRKTKIEGELYQIASVGDSATPSQLREWARRLGTPDK